MCCTANEVLMRHGIPVAGNFLQQELAIITGAVDAMVVDVQCEMQSLADVAKCYHTKVITTNPRAKMQGATHIEFDEHHGPDIAKKILREAIDNFPKRKGNPYRSLPRPRRWWSGSAMRPSIIFSAGFSGPPTGR